MDPKPSSTRPTIQQTVFVAPVNRRRHPHFLEQIKGEGAPSRFNLSAEEMIVGRDQGADICVGGESVSRKHARIRQRNQEYVIFDLDSSHGIYLNGIKVHSAVLRDGDVLQLGDAVFVYEEG
jgi:pSer/pThr/pTyr-binding forkhead associated (FHA) protein